MISPMQVNPEQRVYPWQITPESVTLKFRQHRRVIHTLISSRLLGRREEGLSPSELHFRHSHSDEWLSSCPFDVGLCPVEKQNSEARLVRHSDDFETWEIPCGCCESSDKDLEARLSAV